MEQNEQIQIEQKSHIVKSVDVFRPPQRLNHEEQSEWEEITNLINQSTHYKKTAADAELIRQYVQIKIIRDRAWLAYNEKPERYTRIVTGICSDGRTPRVLVKENEHYKTWLDCNKQLEKILKDLRLTPEMRYRR